ncbi:DUF4381 domain-containing protein [Parahaliea mediterranea]|uniref:DUF4381 domain-containing protein n=1 Tax=Parahaliea mediterranea TaxID=651086 RepID=UPI000E2EC0B6|nr:DUF4381 domain-containing protein [Parahaliea mediterranea]
MNSDPTSLANLHDIVVPAPVPLWPPAPGWLWLLGFVAIALVWLALRAFSRFQRNRYRREALAELAALRAGEQPPATRLAGLSIVLKRTALTAYPRQDVAQLTGADWFRFLDETGGTAFNSGLGQALEDSTYRAANGNGNGDGDTGQLERLFAETAHWIRRHRPPASASENASTSDDAGENVSENKDEGTAP